MDAGLVRRTHCMEIACEVWELVIHVNEEIISTSLHHRERRVRGRLEDALEFWLQEPLLAKFHPRHKAVLPRREFEMTHADGRWIISSALMQV